MERTTAICILFKSKFQTKYEKFSKKFFYFFIIIFGWKLKTCSGFVHLMLIQSRKVNVYFCQLENIFADQVVRKFYFVTVLPVFLLQICCFPHNCQKHLDDETHSHRNSFRLNQFSHSVASEIVMKIDQL